MFDKNLKYILHKSPIWVCWRYLQGAPGWTHRPPCPSATASGPASGWRCIRCSRNVYPSLFSQKIQDFYQNKNKIIFEVFLGGNMIINAEENWGNWKKWGKKYHRRECKIFIAWLWKVIRFVQELLVVGLLRKYKMSLVHNQTDRFFTMVPDGDINIKFTPRDLPTVNLPTEVD